MHGIEIKMESFSSSVSTLCLFLFVLDSILLFVYSMLLAVHTHSYIYVRK